VSIAFPLDAFPLDEKRDVVPGGSGGAEVKEQMQYSVPLLETNPCDLLI
jgi:hypothetical protein